ncbi:NUDIX domain-containing protein [Oscillatoriales cyanobacterium LEGE 11467]|uniref:NUDIX domain-containing protein n=1 Tax=Zarconia navalis LEGE 11467 TaxID=1828826 RepID=A0A928VSZ2_9CYAN|nr:NUDIX domain-containing protein [Zarconia navalis]MBE9039814.1 NUDIX domain-containing protein [Zarconia navalis LEGE 11467]
MVSKIRVLALAIVQDGDRLFLGKGFDPIAQTTFYRVLGGGVEFGETSLDALKREFQEEIQAELTNIEYVACLESIFTLKEKPKHEVIQLYRCDFADRKFYQLDEVEYCEGKRSKKAYWIERQRFESGELRLVPDGFLQYC